jgi:hypothetical protein
VQGGSSSLLMGSRQTIRAAASSAANPQAYIIRDTGALNGSGISLIPQIWPLALTHLLSANLSDIITLLAPIAEGERIEVDDTRIRLPDNSSIVLSLQLSLNFVLASPRS